MKKDKKQNNKKTLVHRKHNMWDGNWTAIIFPNCKENPDQIDRCTHLQTEGKIGEHPIVLKHVEI